MPPIIGLDIGTTKVCVCVANIKKDGKIDILGTGTKPCSGLSRGMVSNISQTVSSIEQAITKAELMSGVKPESAVVGISGSAIKGITSPGIITIKKDRGITKFDVNRVIESAKVVNIPQNMEILHLLPQSFSVDNQDGIEDPIGMIGTKLETEVYTVTVKTFARQNLEKCVSNAGLKIIGKPVLSLLAGASAVLSQDEKDLGCVLIDIGGGTTDMAIFIDGSLYYVYSLAIGGTNITKDISIVLRTSLEDAEKIKKEKGVCLSSLVFDEEEINLQSLGDRSQQTIPQHALSEIIQSRMEEIFSMLDKEIDKKFREKINGGIVLIGGASMMTGCIDLAKQIFNLPVRLGIPQGINGLVDAVSTPFYAVPVGLIIFSQKFQKNRIVTKKLPKFLSGIWNLFNPNA